MSHVVLVRPSYAPPEEWSGITTESRPPAGLLYVAAPLVAAGYSVSLIDQGAEESWARRLESEIGADTLCVGITCLTGRMILNGLNIARIVRGRSDCPIVWGGVHPSIETATSMTHPMVDVVVIGEGEETMLDLVNALAERKDLSRIPGIASKRDGKILLSPSRRPYDLNALPRLPLELVDLDQYRHHVGLTQYFRFRGDLAVSIESSRGCTHRCTYCVMASKNFQQKARWKGMTADKLATTVADIRERYGVKAFAFVDDNFFVDMPRANRFLDIIQHDGLSIEWFADIRMDTILNKLDVASLTRMEELGLRSLSIGIESGSDRTLKRLRKGESRETFVRANRLLAATSITPQYGFILGLPEETLDDVAQSYSLAVQLARDNPNAAITLNKLLPTPGTPLFDECVEHGFKAPASFEGWAEHSDTKWQRGPAVWMDPASAQFIMSQLHFHDVLKASSALPKRGRMWEGVRSLALFLMSLRLWQRCFGFPVERFFYRLLRSRWIFRRIKKFFVHYLVRRRNG